ncbi:formate dehydrogenase subunit delta [Roseateles koreensis]|uniref:Formate dehydrogenase subunit delta n=1 Tax=Roseateles koreensis TaxID=2987526 RepID=A0ABT5KS34_9BURK|nr:formate dehydrogenase subunit delta [Roseateles koreensis]MDC8785230.1 formate dehydrogenase subunit delta [Roseateles koreensis]
MHIDNLIDMANRIGQFFQAMPDAAEATQGIAEHLRKFWTPTMRRELLAHLEATQAPTLLPIVREALTQHRLLLG